MSSRTATNPRRADLTQLVATICLGSAAVSAFLYMPILAGALSDTRHFSAQKVGEFSSLQLTAISIGCFANAFLSRRLGVRAVGIVSVIVLLSMDFLSPYLSGFTAFLVSRGVAGLAGGAAVSLATGLLAQSPQAERSFGMFVTLQIVLKIVALWFLPDVVARLGLHGVFLFMVAFDAIALAGVWAVLPEGVLHANPASHSSSPRLGWILSGLVLLGMLALFSAIGGVWTYVGFIGAQTGLAQQDVGRALSLATFGGLIGALAPVFIKDRLGHITPVVFASLAMLISLYALMTARGFAVYSLALAVFCLGWYMVYPYQLSVMASVDQDGRPSVASAALTGLGLGMGPAIVGTSLGRGFTPVYVVGGIGISLAAGLTITSAVLSGAVRPRAGRNGPRSVTGLLREQQ